VDIQPPHLEVWYGVAVSASGQYQTAVVYSGTVGYIYISSNYGVTWAQQTATSQQLARQ
jgi:hypothetical protein